MQSALTGSAQHPRGREGGGSATDGGANRSRIRIGTLTGNLCQSPGIVVDCTPCCRVEAEKAGQQVYRHLPGRAKAADQVWRPAGTKFVCGGGEVSDQ